MGDRYPASICMQGHYDQTMLGGRLANVPAKFCNQCGAPVITQCPVCSDRLLGGYVGVIALVGDPDKICSNCGSPFPWADRDAIVSYLHSLLQFNDHLGNAEQLEVIEQLAVLSTPAEPEKQRIAAGERIKGLAPKVWELAMPVLRGVLTAEVQRKLGLPPG